MTQSAQTTTEPRRVVLPALYPAQHAALCSGARFHAVEASTKAGKTVGCLVVQAAVVLRDRYELEHRWIAPIVPQAKIAWRRARRMFAALISDDNRTELTLTLRNGARWRFLGSDNPDALYGEDCGSCVVDEASRCKADVWPAVRSTLTATGGPAWLIGNVRGRKNWFYRLARRAEAGEPEWHYARLTAWDAVAAKVLARSEIESARRDLPAEVFAELYLAEPTEDGSNPFGLDAIEACCVDGLSSHPVRAWGWDFARKRDWTVGVGLDGAGAVSALVRRHGGSWAAIESEVVERMGSVWGLGDATGVGDRVIEEIQRAGAPIEGYIFTPASKQALMERLAIVLQKGEIRFPRGSVIDTELREFEYSYSQAGVRYSAPDGMHDDAVMGLGLAVAALDRVGWGGNQRPSPIGSGHIPDEPERRKF